MTRWMQGVATVFAKDVRIEWRTRRGINLLLVFVVAVMIVIVFSFGQTPVSVQIQSAVLWIIIVFAASLGLGRSFISEEEQGTLLLLRLHAEGSVAYLGKLLFNLVQLVAVVVLTIGGLLLFLDVQVFHPGLLLATCFIGALGLAGATTLLAALIARTGNRGTLLPVLLLPLLVPHLLSAVRATRSSLLREAGWASAVNDLVWLFAFAGVVITAAVLLFDFVWRD